MWEKASVSSAEFLTRTVKITHEKTCKNTRCVSEGGVVGAPDPERYGLLLAWEFKVPFWFCVWPQHYVLVLLLSEVKCIVGNFPTLGSSFHRAATTLGPDK